MMRRAKDEEMETTLLFNGAEWGKHQDDEEAGTMMALSGGSSE